MNSSLQKTLRKGSIFEPLMILAFLVIIVFVFIIPARTKGPVMGGLFSNQGNQSGYSYNNTTTTGAPAPIRTSAYGRSVTIDSGNAQYSNQAYEEYIDIYNQSDAPVDITGWTLENARGQRSYDVGGGHLESFPSTVVTIPRARAYVSPSGGAPQVDVVLKPGDRATVTTGSIGNAEPFAITSFKENKCSGYLGDTTTYHYSFTPYLAASCIQPSLEIGAKSLDAKCEMFIDRLQGCHAPKVNVADQSGNKLDSKGNMCNGCVDGTPGLSSQCVAFVQSHYSYPACLANHANDPDFYGSTWHIYLGRGLELWAKDHETISLYDNYGKLVDYINY